MKRTLKIKVELTGCDPETIEVTDHEPYLKVLLRDFAHSGLDGHPASYLFGAAVASAVLKAKNDARLRRN